MRRTCLPFLIAASSALGAQAPTIIPQITIGCESCDGPAQFGSIYDVSVSAAGEILVTEKDAPILRRFDASGKSVWTGGKKGRGPGEFILPIRAAHTPSGLLVIDMTTSRITDLTARGDVVATIALTSLATTSGVNHRGDMILGFDDMGRAFRVMYRAFGTTELRQVARLPGSYKNKSVALAPDGSFAVALDGERYEISRFDAQGAPLASITRALERPRRTAQEEAEYRQRLNRDLSMMSAEMKKQGGDGKISRPEIPAGERGLKAHITVDGLRYDDRGRLWVHTMQGDETKTILDVFAPDGSFLGPVTIPMRITSYSLGGSYLVTAGENADGIPVVRVWTVK
jgi:hypothetical protein